MSAASRVDESWIRLSIRVYGINPNQRQPETRHRQHAARFISQGLRVTDDYGYNLTIETRGDGTRRIVRGEDPLGAYNERQRLRTLNQAAQRDESGRPAGLAARELTDYEAG